VASSGNFRSNRELGLRRAEEVVRVLREKSGISASAFQTLSYGQRWGRIRMIRSRTAPESERCVENLRGTERLIVGWRAPSAGEFWILLIETSCWASRLTPEQSASAGATLARMSPPAVY